MAHTNVTPKAPAAAPKAAAPAGRKAATYPETATVTVVKANPKRGASAKRYDLYGGVGATITVKAYLDACKAAAPDEERGRWRSDLAWDVARGFITIA